MFSAMAKVEIFVALHLTEVKNILAYTDWGQKVPCTDFLNRSSPFSLTDIESFVSQTFKEILAYTDWVRKFRSIHFLKFAALTKVEVS